MGEKGHTPMALLYHGLRAEAKTPDDGNKAAEGFYTAIGSMDLSQPKDKILNDARDALETYGKKAGLENDTLSQMKSWIK